MPNIQGKWIKIGESITSLVSNTTRKEVFAASSYGQLLIGI
jgi:hypothetical protein